MPEASCACQSNRRWKISLASARMPRSLLWGASLLNASPVRGCKGIAMMVRRPGRHAFSNSRPAGTRSDPRRDDMVTLKAGWALFLTLFILFPGVVFSIEAESSYPVRPIEIAVGYAPGAWTDMGVRLIAENSKKALKEEIVVLNKPGGAGRVAMTILSKAKPDGHSLVAVTDSGITFTPHFERVPYKPFEDFTFISQFGILDFGTVVLSNSPFHSFKEVIAFARANPEKLTISTPGVGNMTHEALEALSLLEGLKIKLVPFSGAAPAMTALLGGHVMAACTGSSGYVSHLRAKEVRLLAIMSEERLDAYSEVPTLRELGYPLVLQGRHIIIGPKNMGKSIVNKLSETFSKAMNSPDFVKLAKDMEVWTKTFLSGDELKEKLIGDYKRNMELFRKLGMGLKR